MNVYIPIWEDDPRLSPNPFVSSIVDECTKMDCSVAFRFGLSLLWTEECERMDIIHIMWPDFFASDMAKGKDLEERLHYLKGCGVKVVATCHNMHAHRKVNEYSDKAYDIVYGQADIMIHLGEYSCSVMKEKYPAARHELIPHHVYDNIYTNRVSRADGLARLGLNDACRYILCFGLFRNDDERAFVRAVARQLKKEKIRFLAPSFLFKPVGHKNPMTWLKYFWPKIKAERCGIKTMQGGYVSDEELPYYYGASDVSFIQRVDILNSGNLPMGFLMGKVVVGPDMGNVGPLLKENDNPVFTVNDVGSAVKAIKNGIGLQDNGKGEENRLHGLKAWSTREIAERHVELYKDVIMYA